MKFYCFLYSMCLCWENYQTLVRMIFTHLEHLLQLCFGDVCVGELTFSGEGSVILNFCGKFCWMIHSSDFFK